MRVMELRFYKNGQYYSISGFNKENLNLHNEIGKGIEVTDEQIFDALDNLFKNNLNK